MGAVKKGFDSATGFLVGGKTVPGYQKSDGPSEQELNRAKSVEGDINSLYNQQAQNGGNDQGNADQATTEFKNQLVQFLNSDHGPNPSPDQVAASQHFVDQTFYQPAQDALKNYEEKFGAAQAAKTAAMGRNPNLDLASQQAQFQEGMKNRSAIEAERGSRVAQDARTQNDTSYNRDLGTLNAGMQGSNFLNSLAQQAFSNRLGLLNGRSQLNDYFQRDRLANKTFANQGTSSGIMTDVTSSFKGLNDMTATVGNKAEVDKTMGSMGSAGGGLASLMSDERLKTKIQNGTEDIFDFLRSLTPYNYFYKDQKYGVGSQYSVMAQDMEKTPVGKTLIKETSEGKMIDYSKAFALIVASQAALMKRIDQMEAKG